MANIKITLKINDSPNRIYWHSKAPKDYSLASFNSKKDEVSSGPKPEKRYELSCYIGPNKTPNTLYNPSLRDLFKDFFEKNGFTHSVSLEFDSSVNFLKKAQIKQKFQNVRNDLIRRRLKLNENDPIPADSKLEAAIQAADITAKKAEDAAKDAQLEKEKLETKNRFERYQISLIATLKQKATSAQISQKITASIALLCLIAIGVVGACFGAGVLPLVGFGIMAGILALPLLSATYASIVQYFGNKAYLSEAKRVDQLTPSDSLQVKQNIDRKIACPIPFSSKSLIFTHTTTIPETAIIESQAHEKARQALFKPAETAPKKVIKCLG